MNTPKRNLSYPFGAGVLPNKNRVREKGGKFLAAAVLNVWVTQEPQSHAYLIYLLKERRITLHKISRVIVPDTQLVAQSLTSLTGVHSINLSFLPLEINNENLLELPTDMDTTPLNGDIELSTFVK